MNGESPVVGQDIMGQNTVQALWKITKVILDTLDFNQVAQKICDSLLNELGYLNLGYRIIVLSLYDESSNSLRRISLSHTQEATAAVEASTIPFHDIAIPLSATDNLCVKAYLSQQPYTTHDWKDLLTPPLEADAARTNQSAAGIKTSMVFPIVVKGRAVGVAIFSLVKEETEVLPSEHELLRGFTDIIGIAVQNARLYSDLESTTHRLDEANRKLEALDKLKDEFISITSHELRTPMTAIKSYVWLVLNGKAGDITTQSRDYLDKVYQSTERLIHLVSEMLDVSRIESGRVQINKIPLDLYALSQEVRQEFQARAAEQQLTLESQITPDFPQVAADKEKIHQVLENLVGNAFKYTPQGGKVTISARTEPGSVVISITDTGTGIKTEDLPRLFAKFGRLENSRIVPEGSSSGLGLFICKQYVELHGGKIGVTSQLGQGSVFSFSLPLDSPSNQSTLQ